MSPAIVSSYQKVSSPIFNCYVEKNINIVKFKLLSLNIEIKIGRKTVSILQLVNDIVILVKSEVKFMRYS